MSGESRLPTSGADRTEASDELAAPQGPAPRTPDESTEALVASNEAVPPSSGEDDLPRLAPGERLAGRFEVLRFIARGGMGAVYEAEDVMLRARVALKVIRGRIATDATAMERFRREVLLARRVSHPNVCRVYELYDATTTSGVPIHFLTMELLEGETLGRRIARQGRLTTEEALPLVRQMCDGLAAAHAEGVIHRDFKSSNVLLVPRRNDGGELASTTRAVITDFGIARAIETTAREKGDGPLTGGAAVLGTPEYMAPEQVTGRPVTAATDLYALGVVLYEMVTGKLPFTGNSPLVAAARRLNEPPPRPDVETPGLDKRWSATILRCLEREPERRFRGALEIPPALEHRGRPAPRVLSINGMIAAGILVGVGCVLYILVTNHRMQSPTAALVTAPRPVVAILGFRNELASPDLTWLSTAISESLEHELAAAETSLRIVPGDRVAMVRRSLGVSEDAVNEEKPRERMQALLAANVLAYGTLKPTGPGSASVGLSVKLVDALTGRGLATVDEDLGEGASAMADKVSNVAERLREALGVSLTQDQLAGSTASRWRNLAATRSYARGVMSLRKFVYANARSHFEAALASDSSFVDAQWRVVETWQSEGYQKKAREAFDRARAQPIGLSSRRMAYINANIQFALNRGKRPEAFNAMFDATPDDIELGMSLMRNTDPETVTAILGRLRGLPAPASGDIRLDLLEARTAWQLGDRKRAGDLLESIRVRAKAIGARTEEGQGLWVQAEMLWLMDRRPSESLERFLEAEKLFEETGELEALFWTRHNRAYFLTYLGPPSRALKALEEAAALARRLGNRSGLSLTLLLVASEMEKRGELELAKRNVREVLADAESLDDSANLYYFAVTGRLAYSEADLDGLRKAVRMLQTEQFYDPYALALESRALIAQDHLGEARETLEKQKSVLENRGNQIAVSISTWQLCGLTCEEGHPHEGLACLAHAAAVSGLKFGLELARCRYVAGDTTGTESAAVAAMKEAEGSELYENRILSNVYLMRARAARGEISKAIASLRTDLADTERRKTKPLAFEVALALGDVELRAGRPEGRARLVKLEQEAKSKEFFRIARLAREALDHAPVPARPVH